MAVLCSSCGSTLLVTDDGSALPPTCPRCRQTVASEPSAGQIASPLPEPPMLARPEPSSSATANERDPSGASASVRQLPIVPGYEVQSELGRGGMGVVYKARQLQPRRIVALKMILAGEHAGHEQLARFRTEAEAVARLQHPTIIQVHQVCEWYNHLGHALPYLILEYVPGESLAHRLSKGPPIPARQAADLIRQLALGVHYAHGRGVIHRDLKPGNVLIDPKGANADTLGIAKIVDFGLAKTLEGVASIALSGPQTQTGTILGTPSYMAPEQADGKGRNPSPATDIYALGAIFYECLAGRPPFEAGSTLDTLIQVVHEEATRPRQIRPQIPRDLETICLVCLQKDPARRYASAEDLAEDLRRFLDGEAVRVRPPSSLERFIRWGQRRKEFAYLAAGLLVPLLIVGLVALLWQPPAPTKTGPLDSSVPGPSQGSVVQGPNQEGEGEGAVVDALAEARSRVSSSNNLKQILVALHNYHDQMGRFPPPAILRKNDGKPLLSWRVLILPFVEEENLYRQFRLDEPWDSEHNARLMARIPRVFQLADKPPSDPTATYYQAIVGKGTAWDSLHDNAAKFGAQGRRLHDFTDGTSNTIVLAETDQAVPWTKPADILFTPPTRPRLGGLFRQGIQVGMGDGSVRFVRQDLDARILRDAITPNGGELLPPNWDDPPRTAPRQTTQGTTTAPTLPRGTPPTAPPNQRAKSKDAR